MNTDFLFEKSELIPVIVQDYTTNQVLMLAYMNQAALSRTLAEGKTCFYSRSRGNFWIKGETSGHFQHVREIFYDCDCDTLLIKVDQIGVACHTGEMSCFFNRLETPD